MLKMDNKHDLEYGLLVGVFAILFRCIFIQDGYMNIDSYYYLQATKGVLVDGTLLARMAFTFGEVLTNAVLIAFIGGTSMVMYLLCRRFVGVKASLFSSVLFSLSPLVFFNNQIGIFDKNIYTLFMVVFGLYIMTFKDDLGRFLGFVAWSVLFYYMWRGSLFMILILLGWFTVESVLKKRWLLIAPLIVTIVALFYRFNVIGKAHSLAGGTVFGVQKELIGETRYIFNAFVFEDYLIFLIALVAFLIILPRTSEFYQTKYRFFIYYLCITLVAFIYMFRLNIFFLPIVYLVVAWELDHVTELCRSRFLYVWLGVTFILVMGLSLNEVYLREPMVDPGLIEALEYAETLEPGCIVGDWGKGHIYGYYTSKEIMFKGHSHKIREQLDIMVYGVPTGCIIVYQDYDAVLMGFMMDVLNITNSSPFYVDIVKDVSFTYENKTYWVI